MNDSDVIKSKHMIIEWCQLNGCCSRCTLRLIGHMNFDNFKNEQNVCKKLSSFYTDGQWTPSVESSKQICISCIDLLADDDYKNAVKDMIKGVKESGHEFDSFHLQISLPANVTLRHEIITRKLSYKLMKQSLNFNFSNILSVKDTLRCILIDHLEQLLSKPFDSATPSHFTISVVFSHDNVLKECEKLFQLCPTSFFPKKCRKSIPNHPNQWGHFNHSAILRCLDAVGDDTQLINEWEFNDDVRCKVSSVECQKAALFLAGRYLKYSRQLSQTPWIIDGEKRMESSVQEMIVNEISKRIPSQGIKFSSSGREDVDVRMLGRGRPFVLEISDPKVAILSQNDLTELQSVINKSSRDIAVRDLQLANRDDINTRLKQGEENKTKTYQALCCISRPFTEDDKQRLSQINNLLINQKTPVRVLHRRTLSTRQRTIHKLWTESVTRDDIPLDIVINESDLSQLFKLNLITEAGCYVKEFVHSDFGRTLPNLGSILGHCKADILQLDVMEINMEWPKIIQHDLQSCNGQKQSL